MIDKKLIVLLLILLVYIFFIKPKSENIKPLLEENKFYQKKILKEKYLKENREKIIKNITKMMKVAKKNKEKFFQKQISNSEAIGKIAEFLKNSAIMTNTEFVNSYWGEPIEDETNSYIKLPLSVTIRGYPPEIDKFLKNIFSYEKLLKIERLTVGIYEKQKLVVNFTIIGYKLKKDLSEKE